MLFQRVTVLGCQVLTPAGLTKDGKMLQGILSMRQTFPVSEALNDEEGLGLISLPSTDQAWSWRKLLPLHLRGIFINSTTSRVKKKSCYIIIFFPRFFVNNIIWGRKKERSIKPYLRQLVTIEIFLIHFARKRNVNSIVIPDWILWAGKMYILNWFSVVWDPITFLKLL